MYLKGWQGHCVSKEELHPPPGFSAISEWLEMESDFLSPKAIAKAQQSLHGLSQWDRRYAVAMLE